MLECSGAAGAWTFTTRDLFKHLKKDDKWIERDDVWIKYLKQKGKLTVGYDQCIDLDAWYQREVIDRRQTDSTWPASALDDPAAARP